MFGYVIPYKDELKVREYSVFRAHYCGLCKYLGKEFTQCTRFGLSYDLTFLAILLLSIKGDKIKISAQKCIASPIKKKPILHSNLCLRYCAYMNVILVYFKLLDDFKDGKYLSRLIPIFSYLLPIRKAKKVYNKKYNSIKQYLNQLSSMEKNKCDIIDEIAHIFGKLMEEIFISDVIDDESTIRILKWMGYNLGRWIYIMDAVDDIEKDIEHKNYNPILLQYKYDSKKETIIDFKKRTKKELKVSLTFTLENIARSFELLDVKINKEILNNIIYMGMRYKMDEIFEGSE